MNFSKRHPYLFWEIIGAGLLLADLAFAFVSFMCEFGEWCYPVIAFSGIGAMSFMVISPLIVYAKRRKLIPDGDHKELERILFDKIYAVNRVRSRSREGLFAALGFIGFFVCFFGVYLLGEYVSIVLGLVSLILTLAMPFLMLICSRKLALKDFYKAPEGEKLIDFLIPGDVGKFIEDTVDDTNPPAVVVATDMPEMFWNFFYNWLSFYLKNERLELYILPSQEPRRCFASADEEPNDFLYCIPTGQLDISKEKGRMFNLECDIMGALPLSIFYEPEI